MKIAIVLALVALVCAANAYDTSKIEQKVANFRAKHPGSRLKISEEKLEQYKKIINEKLPASAAMKNMDQEKVKQKLLHKVEMMSKKLELLDAGKYDELKELLTSRKY